MKITRANSQHLEQLAELFNSYRVFYKQPSDLNAARTFLNNRIMKQDSVIFLAFNAQNRAMGFTQLYPSFSSVALKPVYILNDLFVDESYRGEGVASGLMTKATEHAIEKGCRGLTLETGIDNPAQKLYERLGWVKDSEVYHYTLEF